MKIEDRCGIIEKHQELTAKGGRTMAEVSNEKWISVEEAADYLGVKPGTIRDWIRKGKDIPAHKVGKQWKFKCSELDEWIQSGKSADA